METRVKSRERFVSVTLNIISGQAEMLEKVVELTGQTRTELIREALAMYLPSLYLRLTGKGVNSNEVA